MTVEADADADAESRILDKAQYDEAAVSVLVRKQSLDPETFRSDREQRAIVEREFQTAIQACIDVAGLLIAASDEPVPPTNAERFTTLRELSVLSEETGERSDRPRGSGTCWHTNMGRRSTTSRSIDTSSRNSTCS